MTSAHKPIRIIERKQRELAVEGTGVRAEKTAQQIERERVRTVKSWIDGRRKVVEEFVAANTTAGLLRLGTVGSRGR